MGFSITASLIIFSLITCLWVLFDFKYLQTLTPTQAIKGTKAKLHIELHNDKPFLFPYVKLYFQTPEDVIKSTYKEFVTHVFPFTNQKIEDEFLCFLRGKYDIGLVRVDVMDLFGFFKFTFDLREQSYHKPLNLKVSPRVLNIKSLPLSQFYLEGVLNKDFSTVEEPSSIADLRMYRFADPLKKIHWKVSAKLQELYVKNYETNSQPQIMLLIETHPYQGDPITSYMVEDQIIESAAAITQYILTKSLPMNMVFYQDGRHFLQGREPQDFERFLSLLSNLPFNSKFYVSDILKMESPVLTIQSSLIIITHNMTSSIFNTLCLMKQSTIHPMLVLIEPASLSYSESKEMLDDLNEKGIPSFVVKTNERIDKVLEAIL